MNSRAAWLPQDHLIVFADLHLHSCFSDGSFTPEELVGAASAARLEAIALTDHDTMEGCVRAAAAAAAASILFVPACELTAEHEGHELHILGYGLDSDQPELSAALLLFQKARQERIAEIVARLREVGVLLDDAAVSKAANCRAPGRPHIGRALVESGVCKTMDEAFDRFLKKNKPGWAPKFRMSAVEVIQLIHTSGGVAVLAHPALYRFDSALPALVAQGLDGLECYHTKHTPGAVEHYTGLAIEHGLLVTGGSDCHGYIKGNPVIGTVRLTKDRFEALVGRMSERKQQAVRLEA